MTLILMEIYNNLLQIPSLFAENIFRLFGELNFIVMVKDGESGYIVLSFLLH